MAKARPFGEHRPDVNRITAAAKATLGEGAFTQVFGHGAELDPTVAVVTARSALRRVPG